MCNTSTVLVCLVSGCVFMACTGNSGLGLSGQGGSKGMGGSTTSGTGGCGLCIVLGSGGNTESGSGGASTGLGGMTSYGGGTIVMGGVTGGAGGVGAATGGIGGTTICPAIACLLPNCPYGIVPSTSPCGCPTCAPAPDGGGDAGNTSDVAVTGGSPETGGGMADARVSCSPQSKCPNNMVCGYSIVQGCSALGTCLLRPTPLPCNAIVELAACGCDGKTINWSGGCSPSMPDGFAPAPAVHNGVCP
jgi:hypothetical protein